MIETLTGSQPKIKNQWSSKRPYSTGMDIYAQSVYNIAHGKVIFIGRDSSSFINVTVQCNEDECIRYGHLKSIEVSLNDVLDEGAIVGTAKEFVHFEYCSKWQGDSLWPVRISTKTYYKQNPSDILEGTYELYPTYKASIIPNGGTVVSLTLEQQQEFLLDNRGDRMYG